MAIFTQVPQSFVITGGAVPAHQGEKSVRNHRVDDIYARELLLIQLQFSNQSLSARIETVSPSSTSSSRPRRIGDSDGSIRSGT